MTENQQEILNRLNDNMLRLIEMCRTLKEENKSLLSELNATKEMLVRKNADCVDLQSRLGTVETKYKNLKLIGATSLSENDKQENRARFSRLVREIDKCILLLNE